MRQLFINADDFGLHADINRAIAAGVEKQRIHGLSVSANGATVEWPLLAELKQAGAAIGVHLTWADESWLIGGGGLSRSMIIKRLVGNSSGFADKLRREAFAQVEQLLEHGIRPDHVDSHQHIHVLPVLWQVTRDVARKFSIPRIRIPRASSPAGVRKSPGGFMLESLSRFRRRNFPSAWPCAGIAQSGHNTSAVIENELRNSNGPVVELIVHPAFATESLRQRYPHWGYDWESERAMLMQDQWTDVVQRCGFQMYKRT